MFPVYLHSVPMIIFLKVRIRIVCPGIGLGHKYVAIFSEKAGHVFRLENFYFSSYP